MGVVARTAFYFTDLGQRQLFQNSYLSAFRIHVFPFLPMTNKETDYRAMARRAQQMLADTRDTWAAEAPRLVPDYERLATLLTAFDAVGTLRAGTGTKGYTDAKDLAEAAAVAAAVRVVKGVRAVQLTAPRPELAAVAALSKSGLDKLRNEELLLALDAVRAVARPLAAALAEERVTAAHLDALDAATAAYRPLVGTPRGQVIQGSTLRTTGRKLVAELRAAFGPLDTRMDTLEEDFPELVALYRRARRIVKSGGGPGKDAESRAGK